jgi:hypothetical protein
MRDFHMSEKEALNYPLDRAFALCNFAIETNPWARVVYDTDGYIAQEVAARRASLNSSARGGAS